MIYHDVCGSARHKNYVVYATQRARESYECDITEMKK